MSRPIGLYMSLLGPIVRTGQARQLSQHLTQTITQVTVNADLPLLVPMPRKSLST